MPESKRSGEGIDRRRCELSNAVSIAAKVVRSAEMCKFQDFDGLPNPDLGMTLALLSFVMPTSSTLASRELARIEEF